MADTYRCSTVTTKRYADYAEYNCDYRTVLLKVTTGQDGFCPRFPGLRFPLSSFTGRACPLDPSILPRQKMVDLSYRAVSYDCFQAPRLSGQGRVAAVLA